MTSTTRKQTPVSLFLKIFGLILAASVFYPLLAFRRAVDGDKNREAVFFMFFVWGLAFIIIASVSGQRLYVGIDKDPAIFIGASVAYFIGALFHFKAIASMNGSPSKP